jgi:hypothetical protein
MDSDQVPPLRFEPDGRAPVDEARSDGAELALRPLVAPSDGTAERMLVVPREPGPLHDLTQLERSPDDLDAAIDDVFGAATDERPGVFDLVLLVVGVGLVGWAWLNPGATVALVIGLAAILLAVALPGRAALQAVSTRRAARRRRAAIATGYPLDASAPATADLVDAYEELLQASNVGGPLPVDQARAAGYLAVVECAVLLDGRPPVVSEETSYVQRRTRAIRDLSADLLRAHRDWLDRRSAEARDRTTRRATAVVGAVEELQAAHRASSVDQLERVSRVLRRGLEDAATDTLTTATEARQ